ncbi:MAG TPA: hypothetical protein DDW88_00605, partial [Treponema sp.]|nr:hypothetical protein [Treponema sp.]
LVLRPALAVFLWAKENSLPLAAPPPIITRSPLVGAFAADFAVFALVPVPAFFEAVFSICFSSSSGFGFLY